LDNILGQEDYFKGYQDNIDKMREEGEHFEFDKKCYEVFKASEACKKLPFAQRSRGSGEIKGR
jgi:hypothetical protein